MTISADVSGEKMLLWDAHTCVPLLPDQDLGYLERHRQAGVNFVSVNVGMDFTPLEHIVRVIAGFRSWIARHEDRFLIGTSIEDIEEAKRSGRLSVGFDLEGSVMLQDDLAMISFFRDLGVGQIHLAYNRDNSIAGGCHGAGGGLTPLGFEVVREINAVGMIMDCSHASKRSSLDIMNTSSKPVVFSHSSVRALNDHPRNVDDEQINACARTDGVIGICGIAEFLGSGGDSTDNLIRHIDHVAALVGPRHIGLGLDYVFNQMHSDLPAGLDTEDWWPSQFGYHLTNGGRFPPERLPELADALVHRGYDAPDIRGIMGENFLRVAQASWVQ